MADNIKVVIKVRPLIKREIDDNLQKQWTVSENTIFPTVQQLGREGIGEFTFDYVFDDESLTQDVYEKVARPIVEAAVGGMNGTIFAYGQTSSGKTYTMMGDAASKGVIPLAIANIFHTIESKVDRDFLLRVSYIEIYNEKIRDLLDVSNTDLKIHEDYSGQVIVKCKEEVTSKPNQVLELMKKGDRNRSTGETQMNERSSRSHTIFIIIIESRRHVMPGEEEENSVNVSQLNLVDLAGSERPAQTGATHQRLREGGHINKSLHMLGNVIRQLSDAQGDTNRFISFRDSKLTRILQTSLGGNAKTGIICAVTPAVLDETYSTLKFAMCAKAIENKPKINAVVSDATQIKTLTREMKSLQEELESKKHLEVDNKRLQEQLALLRDKILMGNSEEVSVQRAAALRRRTWCAPQRSGLPPIQEHAFQRKNFNSMQRLSNVTERDDESITTSRDSASSSQEIETPLSIKNTVQEEIVILDDSNEDTISNNTHMCLDPNCTEIYNTPLCKWKYRAMNAEKELIQLEELTSLEKTCGPIETELLQNISNLRLEKKSADEKCNEVQKDLEFLQDSLELTIKERDEANTLRKKLEEETTSLKNINIDLEFQIENLQERSHNREKELLNSLKEARQEKERPYDRSSIVPKFLNLSRDMSLLANSDAECTQESATDDKIADLENIISERDLALLEKDNNMAKLQVLLNRNNLEMDAIKLELEAKITLIETMEARTLEKCDIFCQQTKLYSELQTQFENLTKDLDESRCKLAELTHLTQSIPAYESEIQQLKEQITSINDGKHNNLPNIEGQTECDKITQLEATITSLNQQITHYQEQLSEEELNVQQKESDLKSMCENNIINSDEISALRESISTLQTEKIELMNDCNMKSSQIAKLTQDLSDSIIQFSSISEIREELQKNLDKIANEKITLIDKLQQTIAQLEDQIQQNNESHQLLKETNDKVESEKLLLETLVNEKSYEITELTVLITTLRNSLETLEMTLETKSQALSQKEEEIVLLKIEDDHKKISIEELKRSASNYIVLCQEKDQLASELNVVTKENVTLSDNIIQLQSDLNSKLEDIGKFSEEILSLQSELKSLLKNAEKEVMLERESDISKMTQDLETSHGKVAELQIQLGEAQTQNQNLDSSLQRLLKDISSIAHYLQTCYSLRPEENTELPNDIVESDNVDVISICQVIKRLLAAMNNLQHEISSLEALHKTNVQHFKSEFSKMTKESSQGVDNLQVQLDQALSQKHSLDSALQRLLQDVSSVAAYLQKEDGSKLSMPEEDPQTILESVMVQSENKDINSICHFVSSLKLNLITTHKLQHENESLKALNESNANNYESDLSKLKNTFQHENESLKALNESNANNYESDLSKLKNTFQHENESLKALNESNANHYEKDLSELKNTIDTLNQDIIKIKLMKKEREDVQYLVKDSYNDKENINNKISSVTPLKNKNDDFLSSDSQLNLSPYFSPVTVKSVKTKSYPFKYKQDIKKVLEVILNELNSQEVSGTPIHAIFDTPELMTILVKIRELKMALKESLESNNLLKEKVLSLENINNELKTLLFDTFVTISELDKIHHEKYTDGEITFSGSIVDDYIDVMKQSIHNILSLKSVLQKKLSFAENTLGSESASLSVPTVHELVNLSQVQGDDQIVSSLDESKCVVDETTCTHGIRDQDRDLEMLISTLENNISEVYSRLEVQRQKVLTDVDTDTPVNVNLEAKLTKIINMHSSLVQHIEDLILFRKNDNDKLIEENVLLKSEMQQNLLEVKELVKEAEELQKRVLNQRSESEVSNAEYSLLNSRLTSVQHYHTNLHSSCISTASNMRLELTELQSLLQDLNQTESENTYYTDDFITPKKACILETQIDDDSEKTPVSLVSNLMVDKSQCTDAACGVSLIGVPEKSDESLKATCENLHCNLNSKCSENRRLLDQLTDHESLKRRYHQLQNEHESLSNELMDSLQEVDETKSKYQSLKKELSMVNECIQLIKQSMPSDEGIENDKQFNLWEFLNLYVAVIKKQNEKSRGELILLADTVKSLQSEITSKQDMLSDYQNQMSNNVTLLQTELHIKFSEIAGLEIDICNFKEQIKDISVKLEDCLADNQREISEKQNLESTIANLLQKIQEAEVSNAITLSNMEKMIVEHESLRTLNLEHESEKLNLLAEIRNLENQMKSKETGFLKECSAKLSSLEDQINNQLFKISQLQDDLKAKDSNMEKMAVEHESLQTLSLEHESDKLNLLAEIKNLENRVEAKETGFLEEYSDKLSSMQDQINKQVSEISQLQGDLRQKEINLTSMTEKYDDLFKAMTDLNADMETHKVRHDEYASLQQSSLEEKLKLVEEIIQFKKELEHSKEAIDQLHEALSMKSSQLEALHKEKETLVDKENNLSQSLDEQYKKFLELKTHSLNQEKALKEMQNSQLTISELQAELTRVQEENKNLSNEIKMLENKVQTSLMRVKESEEELHLSVKQFGELSDENATLKQSLQKLAEAIEIEKKTFETRLQEKGKHFEDNIVKLNEHLQSKLNMIIDFENKLSKLTETIAEKELLIDNISHKYEDEKNKYSVQVTCLEEQINKLRTENKNNEEAMFSLMSNTEQLSCLLNEKDQEIQDKTKEITQLKTLSRTPTSLEFKHQKLLIELKNQKDYIQEMQSKITSMEERTKSDAAKTLPEELESQNSRLLSVNTILENRIADLQSELNTLLRSSPKMRHDLHLRRQSLHDQQRNLAINNASIKAEDNDVSMEDCVVAIESSGLKEKVKQLEWQLNATQERYVQLEQALTRSEQSLKHKAGEYAKVVAAYQNTEDQLEEMRQHIVTLSSKNKQDASTNTNQDDSGSLMSLFVDKLTHDILKEKHRAMQRANEDYRMRNKEQATELRRLQHSLQNNTLHSLLPKDGSKDPEKLQGEIKSLEQELKAMKEKQKEQEDWEAKYKEMDAEYDVCADELRETVISYSKVFSEKQLVEAELKYLKGKMDELQEGSPSWELRKRRQSLHDTRRGTSLSTVEASTNTVQDDSSQSARLQPCEKCEPIRQSLQQLQTRNMELESHLSLRPTVVPLVLSPTPHLIGAGVVQTQKLHEYMKENQILRVKAEKYKEFYLKYRNQKKKNSDK